MKKTDVSESLTKGLTEALLYAKGEIELKTTILSEEQADVKNKSRFFSNSVF
jgi:hypothetical protein